MKTRFVVLNWVITITLRKLHKNESYTGIKLGKYVFTFRIYKLSTYNTGGKPM